MSTPPAIEVRGLSKSFRIPHVEHQTLRGRILHPFSRTSIEAFDALDDVSFTIHEGEFFGIVGRNGSGKSTLLKVLAGIYRPDAGEVVVNGSVAPFIELGVGFNPELSGRDNVYINGALLGLSRGRIDQRYDDIVKFAELERFMDLKLRNFSSGMQVRLAFAIALEAGADILLTDEVLAVGDENFQRKCFDVFRSRKRSGQTVVFVTHDMSAVLDFCDRTLLLDHGRVEMLGDTRDVVRRYHKLNETEREDFTTPDGTADSEAIGHIRGVTLIDTNSNSLGTNMHVEVEVGLRVDVDVQQALTNPVVGIIVTDHLGKQVTLANTYWSGIDTGLCDANSRLTVTFWFTNILAAGDYVVRAEFAKSGAGPIIDVLDEGLRFTVERPVATGGTVDLPMRIETDHADQPVVANA